MNIVKISAGLGNQIFQYAFYRTLKKNSPDTKMDILEFNYRKHHNGYELEKVFNIVPDYATQQEINKIADISKDFFSEIRRKIFKAKLKVSGEIIQESEIGNQYHPELQSKENTYFSGFWQSEKYFKSIETQLREELTFKKLLDDENQKIANLISTTNSVSIHIRRGDYVKSRRVDTFGSVCTPTYYANAIRLIQSKINNPHFFVFSDDLEWVKENMQIPEAYYVDINTGDNSYKDMQLMSLCRHNIIANSSFSWWGAWLNKNPDKIILAPSIWIRERNFADIIPDAWVRINVE